MNQSTIEKSEASRSSDEESEPRGYTLAQAVEEAAAHREACLQVRNDMEEDLDRFRAVLRHDLKERNRKLDLRDWMMIAGLALGSIGIAVAFHWAYSMIAMSVVLVGLSVFPLLRQRPAK